MCKFEMLNIRIRLLPNEACKTKQPLYVLFNLNNSCTFLRVCFFRGEKKFSELMTGVHNIEFIQVMFVIQTVQNNANIKFKKKNKKITKNSQVWKNMV